MTGHSVDVADLRPTQLYLNAGKLATVLDRVEGDGFDPGPLPVYRFDAERGSGDGGVTGGVGNVGDTGDLYLTDGHTRAFAARLTGAESIAVEYDADLAEEHDLALYRECIRWCEAAGVERVPDLAGRVLGPAEYEDRWIERCHRAAEELD